jgi:hypothetical protein
MGQSNRDSENHPQPESGVALRFPPQSKPAVAVQSHPYCQWKFSVPKTPCAT